MRLVSGPGDGRSAIAWRVPTCGVGEPDGSRLAMEPGDAPDRGEVPGGGVSPPARLEAAPAPAVYVEADAPARTLAGRPAGPAGAPPAHGGCDLLVEGAVCAQPVAPASSRPCACTVGRLRGRRPDPGNRHDAPGA